MTTYLTLTILPSRPEETSGDESFGEIPKEMRSVLTEAGISLSQSLTAEQILLGVRRYLEKNPKAKHAVATAARGEAKTLFMREHLASTMFVLPCSLLILGMGILCSYHGEMIGVPLSVFGALLTGGSLSLLWREWQDRHVWWLTKSAFRAQLKGLDHAALTHLRDELGQVGNTMCSRVILQEMIEAAVKDQPCLLQGPTASDLGAAILERTLAKRQCQASNTREEGEVL